MRLRSRITGILSDLGTAAIAFIMTWGLLFCIGVIIAATWFFTHKGEW